MRQSSPRPGLKQFFTDQPHPSASLHIRGLGIREPMPAGAVERPHGTGDYLFMLFHNPAFMASHAGRENLQRPETMMIWTPGRGQYYGNRQNPYVHSWIHCHGTKIPKLLRASSLPLLTPFISPASPLFQQCLLDLHAEMTGYHRPDPVICGNLIEIAFHHVARAIAPDHTTAHIPEKLLAVRQFIGSAPARPLSLDEMASMAGLSVSHFCFRFKQCFGLPPVEYLIRHRMQHALHLLGNLNLNISQVAALTGYDDLFHFSKTFKKHFGLSPRRMRQHPKGPLFQVPKFNPRLLPRP